MGLFNRMGQSLGLVIANLFTALGILPSLAVG